MYLLLSVIALLMYTNPIAALLMVFYEKDGEGALVIPLEDRKTDLIHLRASMPQELLCYLLR